MALLQELKRRNVFRVGIAYLVAAWLLLQVADIVLEAIEAPSWTMKAVLLAVVLGFPLALIFAWAFEMTPEGIKLEKDVDRSKSVTRETGRKLNYGIIGILALAVGLLLYDKLVRSERSVEPIEPGAEATQPLAKSIAVLPFVNMSADPNNEYFSDGLSEELLNLLAKVEGLKVAARTSSFKFKNSDADIGQIGEALGVATVLEGSVRRTGDQARITAQLINVEDGFHLWSETYDRSLENIFEVQDEIAGAIVDALQLPLMGAASAPVAANAATNFQAYDLYLLGRHRAREVNADAFRQAIDYFERAIAADPNYAPAYSGLADAYLGLADYGDLSMTKAVTAAETAVNRALSLDASLAEAWASKGTLARRKWHMRDSASAFDKSLALNPNSATTLINQSLLFNSMNQTARSFQSASRAFELDPLSDWVRELYLVNMASAGQKESAREQLEAWAAAEPENPFPFEGLGDLFLESGAPQLAVIPYARAHRLRSGDTFMARRISEAFLQLNDLPSARRWVEEARKRGPQAIHTQVAAYLVSLVEGDVQAQLRDLTAFLEQNPESIAALSMLGDAQLRAGNLDTAEAALREVLDRAGDGPYVPLHAMLTRTATNLAAILQRHGKQPEFDRLLGRLVALRDQAYADRPDSAYAHYLAAQIASLQGDREAMLDALRQAAKHGFRDYWGLLVDASFEQWYEDRLFKALISEMERQARAMRAELISTPGGAALVAPE